MTKPVITMAAATSSNALSNCCELLAKSGQGSLIKQFKKEFQEKSDLSTIYQYLTVAEDVSEVSKKNYTLLDMLMYFHENVFLNAVHHNHGFYSREGCKIASKSELKRWIAAKNVQINGYISDNMDEEINYPVHSFVLFPGGKTQLTII